MTESNNEPWRYVSVREAARLLGSSPSSIRRRLKLPEGHPERLEHEIDHRPGAQVDAFLVRVPADLAAPDTGTAPETTGALDAPADAPDAPVARLLSFPPAGTDTPPKPADTPPADPAHALLLENLGKGMLGPVLEQLSASHARERGQAEEIGGLKARLEVVLARVEAIDRDRAGLRARLAEAERELGVERAAHQLAERAAEELAAALREAGERERARERPPEAPQAPEAGQEGVPEAPGSLVARVGRWRLLARLRWLYGLD